MGKSKKYTMTHDSLLRRAMSRGEVATEFFSANLPQHILKHVDLTTLKQEKTDFPDKVLGYGIVDLLFLYNGTMI